MILVRLSDGLGNQLFQYAYALCVQQCGAEVQLDCSWFPEFGLNTLKNATPRAYALGPYSLRLPMAPLRMAEKLTYGSGLLAPLRRLLHQRPGLLREGRQNTEPARIAGIGADRLIRGFFQEARYPDMVRPALLEDLRLPEESLNAANREMLEQIRSCNAVAVHIRRGDYLNADCIGVHGICSAEYYAKAVQRLAEQTGQEPHLFVFSDDAAWVRENFKSPCPVTPVAINSGADGHLDINLMRHCRHAVIANSTFSWWGAWLIENPGKLVIAPEHWFADGRDVSALYPPAWLQM